MAHYIRKLRWFLALCIFIPLVSFAATPVKSMVVFGDSLSDTGNTTHLLKSLRQEEDPAFLVAPFKTFVLNKMVEFAEEYYVPQMVLDSGIAIVTEFFDNQLAPYIANLVSKVKMVPVLPGKPYWNSRFSNGQVWNEYLAKMISIASDDEEVYLNRAFGGSWSATYDYQLTVWNLIRHPLGTIKNLIVGKLVPPSLGLTVQAYLLEHPALSEETVFFVFSGSNDYINVLFFEDNYNTEVMSTYVDNVLSSTGSAVMKLMKAGARRFVVMGLPHLGDTPRVVQTTDRDVLNNAIDMHNERLQNRMQEWAKIYPNADFLYINMQEYMERALKNPENYGFTNTQDACIDVKLPMYDAFRTSPFAHNYVLRYAQVLQYRDESFAAGDKNYHVCDTPESYLFWDEIHPSTRAHGLMAFEVCNAMKDHGYSVTCKNPIE
ncbi:lysophospholipase A [Legionella sainthelensi]|uniref:Lysophospholipase A n=1 Tax=Legionella sainthelensi TaxID=28087 RepID=A0A0W0YNK3_9GAMM|nr:SGNH/GDSL hydrolase family protein [Legionella sainthelensi]KTD58287.1 lysophospholipase A [Legionella sainthelensi]VEH27073.1 lysophospholipase A [Legionella sainthelensi]